MSKQAKRVLLIVLLAATAIILNVTPAGGTNMAVAVLSTIMLAIGAVIMETQR